MTETTPEAAPSEGPPGPKEKLVFAGFLLYVATLGVFTVNEIFRLDLGEWEIFTPELHSWVYDLLHVVEVDPGNPAAFPDERSIEKKLTRLRDALARTRYARVVTPGSLEDRLNQYLATGILEPLETARVTARAFYEEGVAEARARLAGEIEDWVTIPILVKYLDHDDPRLRREAFEILKKVAEKFWSEPPHDRWKTEDFFGYDPDAPRTARLEAARRWKAWVRTLDLP